MLAYRSEMDLRRCWHSREVTIAEGLAKLSSPCLQEIRLAGAASFQQILTPRPSVQNLLTAADIKFPDSIPCSGIKVYTKRKPADERKVVSA